MRSNDSKSQLGRYSEPATLVLLSLSEGAKHGYAVMQDVESNMGVKMGPGTLYGAIAKLVELDMIRPLESDARTRPYEITPKGRQAIAEFVASWSPILRLGEARLA